MTSHRPKIIIVGAGASGIAAATKLLENGVHDLIILEAESRIGGRVCSVEFDGSIVDIGGQWCHGEEGNVVYQMVKDLNLLETSHNNYQDNTYYLSNGTVIDKSITDRLHKIAVSIYDDEESAKATTGTFGEFFIKEYRKKVASEFPNDPQVQKLSEFLLDWFHKFFLCLDSPKTWFDVSTTGPFHFEQCKGDPQLQWKDKGYKTILDVLMKKFPDKTKQLAIDDKIFLNKEVKQITWDNNPGSSEGVTVACSDGSSYNADHVIVTASLGSLKNMLNAFVPDLPQIKRNAIEAMTIGTVNKILLKFPEKWWPDDLKGFSLVWSEEDRKKLLEEFPYGPSDNGRSWLEDVFGFYVIDSHPRVLLGWVVGKMAAEVELLPDDVVIKGCTLLLRKFAGQKYNILEPDGVLRSKWKSNPHFNGSYTHISLEAERRNSSPEDLARPVINSSGKPVLLFAGEATHSCFYSTVHGAIETGYREANRILKLYEEPKLRNHKVIIIGAGMAGLGAAKTLFEMGCKDVIILEAQGYAGGRIQTLQWENLTLELGAQWIHGKQNPLYEMARKNALVSDITSVEGLGLYIRDTGEIVDEYLVKVVDFQIGKFLEDCEKFIDSPDYPESVGGVLKVKFEEYLNECGDSEEVREIKWELFDWHLRFQVIDNSCLDMGRLSAKGWGQYVCVDDQAHINLKFGYSQLVQVLLNSLPGNCLLLSTPVSEIIYGNKSPDAIEILCQNGSKFTCEHLILTPSLGVLKNYLTITPPLPQEHLQSIKDLGFHAIAKIFLIFEHKWWNEAGFQLLWNKNYKFSEDEQWLQCITGFDSIFNAPNVLLGWVGGEGVATVENLSEEDVGRHCMKLLRRYLKDRFLPDPIKVFRSRWLSNPWIRGGYCHITPDCDGSDSGMRKLAEPVFVDGKMRILFAGEAVHSSHYSTTHGAFESGQQQAELLCGYIMRNCKL